MNLSVIEADNTSSVDSTSNTDNTNRSETPTNSKRRRRGTKSTTKKVKAPFKLKILIRDVNELPQGRALETPLHLKRRRVWQPTDQDALCRPNIPLGPPPPAPQTHPHLEATPAAACPPLDELEPLQPELASSVPSVAMFVECGGSASSTPSPSRGASQISSYEQIVHALNYGSEASSGESDDEDLASPFMPRAFLSLMETPMDESVNTTIAPADASAILVDPMGTYQPRSFYDFNWEAFPSSPIPPESRRERFSDINVGPTAPCVNPYDIFVAIWDRQFMEHIASETNRYAQQVVEQMILQNNLHPSSRISRWCDTTADELYVYFAIVLAMGVVVKSRLEEYWSITPDIFHTPGFCAHMSFNRFLLISKCLHFNNNEDMCALKLNVSEAKLFKISPVLTHLKSKFETMYNLCQNISLDESLLMWKGWLNIYQLVPNKAAKMGIKTYEICESQTGYLWRFEIHAHKRSTPQQLEDPLSASTPAIVLRLLHGLENKGHTVWMDNYYNSPLLARRLKTLGFDCVGTLRTNRKFVPQELHSLTKANMQPDQFFGLTSGDVDVMVWRDSNRVAMISTYHGNIVCQDRGSTKPSLILDYNIMMGGVDKKDQMLAMYPIERKRTKVWYKKLFKRLLNVSVLNAYIIHKKSSTSTIPCLSQRGFRIALVKSLLSKHCSRPLSSFRPATTVQNAGPADITHRLEDYPIRNGARQRRLCTLCKKRVHTFCVGCGKTVCKGSCFVNLHSPRVLSFDKKR